MLRQLFAGWLFACLAPLFLAAQNTPLTEPEWQELIEQLAKRNALQADFDVHQLTAHLENWLENPLELNHATRAELESLWLLSPEQIESFLAWRNSMGRLLAVEELQALPGWEPDDIRRLRPFIRTDGGGLDGYVGTRKSLIFNGKSELIFRHTRRFEKNGPPSETMEGSPAGLVLGFRHRHGNRVSLGFMAEKDPGEAFFRGSNRRGFDFHTAHFFLKNWSKTVRHLALGDFKINFGQGLLMAGGFSMGKSSRVLATKKTGEIVRPHSSVGEDFFQRGGAVTLVRGDWQATFFTSFLKRDAAGFQKTDSLVFEDEAAFSSFSLGGMHRTAAEISGEKRVGEWLSGTSIRLEKKRFQAGLNGLASRLNHSLEPANFKIRPSLLSGNSLISNSLDYAGGWRNIHFFGETAISQNGGLASLNGLLVGLDRRATLSILQRNFGPRFQSLHGQAFGETREPSNEKGLFLGLELRATKRWTLHFFTDAWRHPAFRAGLRGPSGGQETGVSALFSVRKKGRIQLLFRHEKHEASGGISPVLGEKYRLRLQGEAKISPRFEWRNRIEMTRFLKNEVAEIGFLLSQELLFGGPGDRLGGVFRLIYFESDGFDSRLFLYEKHLEGSQFVPFFAGKGSKLLLRADWRPFPKWSFEGFASRVFYLETERQVFEFKIQVRHFL